MELRYSAEEEAFRQEVRTFVRENLPPGIVERARRGWSYLPKEDHVAWQKILYRQGWMAPGWPREHGGPGWSAVERYIFEEECAAALCPRIQPFGITMVGPVIYTFGGEAQRQRFLPRILASDDWWCQGYSEPGSGSDLASLQTRAVRDGGHYLVNGQKTWTSGAHKADWIFCLVRTDPEVKPQAGISFLLIDMRSPGITVRPIISVDGQHYLNDVFFDDVRVPRENLVGEEGKGWTYAKFLLGHERTGIAGVGRSKQRVGLLKDIARAERADGAALVDDPVFRRKIAALEIELIALEYTNLRSFAGAAETGKPGAESSILKIKGTEVEQTINDLLAEAIGHYAMPYDLNFLRPEWNEEPVGPEHALGIMPELLLKRAASIYGGTNEIQRNIISKMVLGL